MHPQESQTPSHIWCFSLALTSTLQQTLKANLREDWMVIGKVRDHGPTGTTANLVVGTSVIPLCLLIFREDNCPCRP